MVLVFKAENINGYPNFMVFTINNVKILFPEYNIMKKNVQLFTMTIKVTDNSHKTVVSKILCITMHKIS